MSIQLSNERASAAKVLAELEQNQSSTTPDTPGRQYLRSQGTNRHDTFLKTLMQDLTVEPDTDENFLDFLKKCLEENFENFKDAYYDDYYPPEALDTVPYPVEDSLFAIKRLYRNENNRIDAKQDLSFLRAKNVWSVSDVLNILCNEFTTIELLDYGHHGTTFKWKNPYIHGNTVFVLKIGVLISYVVKDFYKMISNKDVFIAQRKLVPYGSLEQYMFSMPWIRPEDKATLDQLRPKLKLVDNTTLPDTISCSLMITSYFQGDWVNYNNEEIRDLVDEHIEDVNVQLQKVGVVIRDIRYPGNVLFKFSENTVKVKNVIDFGEALPTQELETYLKKEMNVRLRE